MNHDQHPFDETVEGVVTSTSAKVEDASRKAGKKADKLKAEAADMAGKAGDKLKDAAASGKDMAADAVHGIASATRDMAGKLDDGHDSGGAKAAEFARKAADGMDRFSATLRTKELNELAADARDAVRQHPAIAVGAAAVIGFALARFLKAGNPGGRDA